MEKQQNFNRNNRNYTNNRNYSQQPQKPRKIFITVPVIDKVIAKFRGEDIEIDPTFITNTLKELEECGAFEKLTQNVTIDRAAIDPEKRGTLNVGFINRYDPETVSMNITIFGGAVQFIDALGDNIALQASVIVDKDGNFKSFNQFSLVKA